MSWSCHSGLTGDSYHPFVVNVAITPCQDPCLEDAVDEGYTYIIKTSPDIVKCLTDKAKIDGIKITVDSKGFTE